MDRAVIDAVDKLYESAKAQVDQAQEQLDDAHAAMVVASRLQDLVHEQVRSLRVVA
jgi:hypothetical protein